MIPAMTDPLGKYWEQPDDIREAPMDGTHVLLTRWQFERLSEYSASIPTGVYPGKCWKREEPGPKLPGERRRRGLSRWLLMWYGECDDPKLCSINHRQILIGRVKRGPA